MVQYSIWTIDITLSGPITSGQSEPGINGNEGVLHIKLSDGEALALEIWRMSYNDGI